MKQFPFLIALVLMLFSGIAGAQNFGYVNDTIGASDTIFIYPGLENQDTDDFAHAKKFRSLGGLHISVQTDSISGATGATLLVQYNDGENDEFWYTVDSNGVRTATTSIAVNGAASQTFNLDDPYFFQRGWRVRVISPSGAQATRLQLSWTYKVYPDNN